jgi:hypothetical protein
MNEHCSEVMDNCDGNFGQVCDDNGDCHCVCYGEGVSAGDSGGSGGYPNGGDDNGNGAAIEYMGGGKDWYINGVNFTETGYMLQMFRINNIKRLRAFFRV